MYLQAPQWMYSESLIPIVMDAVAKCICVLLHLHRHSLQPHHELADQMYTYKERLG